MAGNLVKVKDQIKKWAVSALEEDINGFFGTNASNIVIAMNEEIKELVGTKVFIMTNLNFYSKHSFFIISVSEIGLTTR